MILVNELRITASLFESCQEKTVTMLKRLARNSEQCAGDSQRDDRVHHEVQSLITFREAHEKHAGQNQRGNSQCKCSAFERIGAEGPEDFSAGLIGLRPGEALQDGETNQRNHWEDQRQIPNAP